MTRRSGHESGFTLLEMLVALVVLGLLVGGLAQALRIGVVAWNRQAQIGDRYAQLDAVDRALRRVIEQIDPGNAHDAPTVAGSAASFVFTSELPEGASALPTRRVEMRLLVDGAHRLVLRWAPYSHAQRIGPPPPPTDTLLAEQVERLDLAYWPRRPVAGSGWQADWRETELPGMVRIRLVFVPGSGQQWPDIVAAPQLARP